MRKPMLKFFFSRTHSPEWLQFGLWIGPVCQGTYYIELALGRLYFELQIGWSYRWWPWGVK